MSHQNPPSLELPSAGVPCDRLAAVDQGVDGEIDEGEPPEARRDGEGDDERQRRMA